MGFFNNNQPQQPAQIPALQQIGQISNVIANPQQALLNMMTQQNPAMSQVLSMLNGKSDKQIQQAVTQLCKQNGIDIQQLLPQAQALAKQFGIKL